MIDDPTAAAAEAPPTDDAPPAADADAEPKAPTPPPPPPYQRMSKRVWVVPADATVAAVVEWLDDKHGVATLEKHGVPLSAAGWADSAGGDGAYHAELIEAFKQKGAKPIKAGAKFWKALREAVMERLKTQDLLLLLSDPPPDDAPDEHADRCARCRPPPPPPVEASGSSFSSSSRRLARRSPPPHPRRVTTLLKHLLDAGDARAAADSLVGLKSGKVQVICQGWPHETVRDRRRPPAAAAAIGGPAHTRPSPSHRALRRRPPPLHIPVVSRTIAGSAYLA